MFLKVTKLVFYFFNNISSITVNSSDINSASPNDNDGYQVSLSNDGSVVALGAIRADNNNLTDSGHVRIFNLQAILKQMTLC